MKTKMKAVALASVMAMGLAAATTAQAHPRWFCLLTLQYQKKVVIG